MADHFSGPRTLADPAADITDVHAFPSPERPGHLVLVMNVFPLTAATALFSDALSYRFRVRPITQGRAGVAPAFEPGEDEYAFTVTFAIPHQGHGSDAGAQAGTCTTPGGEEISFQVGDRAASNQVRAAGRPPSPSHIRPRRNSSEATGKGETPR
jgi:uncharacterized protein DUF4331